MEHIAEASIQFFRGEKESAHEVVAILTVISLENIGNGPKLGYRL